MNSSTSNGPVGYLSCAIYLLFWPGIATGKKISDWLTQFVPNEYFRNVEVLSVFPTDASERKQSPGWQEVGAGSHPPSVATIELKLEMFSSDGGFI